MYNIDKQQIRKEGETEYEEELSLIHIYKFFEGVRKMKKALVTGASRGIGYAIAKKLSQNGSAIVITGRNKMCIRDRTYAVTVRFPKTVVRTLRFPM